MSPYTTTNLSERNNNMAVSEADAIKDLTNEEVEDLRETFRTFDKVCGALLLKIVTRKLAKRFILPISFSFFQ